MTTQTRAGALLANLNESTNVDERATDKVQLLLDNIYSNLWDDTADLDESGVALMFKDKGRELYSGLESLSQVAETVSDAMDTIGRGAERVKTTEIDNLAQIEKELKASHKQLGKLTEELWKAMKTIDF